MAANTVAQSSAGSKALLRPILSQGLPLSVMWMLQRRSSLLSGGCIMDEHDDDLASEVIEGEEIETTRS